MDLLDMYDIVSESLLKTICKEKHIIKKHSTRKDSGARLRLHQSPRQQLISYQILDRYTAGKEIQDFIRSNPRCTTSQIISKLSISPEQVAEILDELERNGLAYGKIVG